MNVLCLATVVTVVAFSSCNAMGQYRGEPQSGTQNQLNEARFLAAEGKLDLASGKIREYRKAHPQSEDGAIAEAQLLILENDLSDAASLSDHILLTHPHSLPAMILGAELSRRMNNSAKTERLLIQCTKDAPDDPDTWKRLGDFYLRKQPAKAVSAFSKALKLDSNDALTQAGLASAESDLQFSNEARRDFIRADVLNHHVSRPNAMVDLLYAEFLSQSNRKDESQTFYDKAIWEDASLNDAYLGRAKVEMALQKWEAAAEDLEQIATNPDYSITALALAVKVYKAQGSMEKAAEVSKRLEHISAENDATRSAGHEIAYQLETAADLMRKGNCDKAIVIDQALLKTRPEATFAYLQSGKCYFELDRLNEAEVALRKYLERHGSSADALSMLGRTLLRAGRIDAAREQFHAAWLVDPWMLDASLGLAACAIQQQRYSDAEKILRAAVALPGTSTQAHLMLAECLYKEHRPQPAMEEVSRAIAIDPSDQEALRMKAKLKETESTIQAH